MDWQRIELCPDLVKVTVMELLWITGGSNEDKAGDVDINLQHYC